MRICVCILGVGGVWAFGVLCCAVVIPPFTFGPWADEAKVFMKLLSMTYEFMWRRLVHCIDAYRVLEK